MSFRAMLQQFRPGCEEDMATERRDKRELFSKIER